MNTSAMTVGQSALGDYPNPDRVIYGFKITNDADIVLMPYKIDVNHIKVFISNRLFFVGSGFTIKYVAASTDPKGINPKIGETSNDITMQYARVPCTSEKIKVNVIL